MGWPFYCHCSIWLKCVSTCNLKGRTTIRSCEQHEPLEVLYIILFQQFFNMILKKYKKKLKREKKKKVKNQKNHHLGENLGKQLQYVARSFLCCLSSFYLYIAQSLIMHIHSNFTQCPCLGWRLDSINVYSCRLPIPVHMFSIQVTIHILDLIWGQNPCHNQLMELSYWTDRKLQHVHNVKVLKKSLKSK